MVGKIKSKMRSEVHQAKTVKVSTYVIPNKVKENKRHNRLQRWLFYPDKNHNLKKKNHNLQ